MDQNADQISQLCKLCREGRLFEVEQWCKDGKPVDFHHRNPCLTPIGIAIDKGFHSLVELLVRNGVTPSGFPLRQAVRRGKTAIVELLFRYGADSNSVHLSDVLCQNNPEVIKLFIERGADLGAEALVARTLSWYPRKMVRILKPYFKQRPELHLQANMALRHFCAEGDLPGASLLLWLGANPRVKAPEKGDQPEDQWETAMIDAVWGGHLDIVKKLAPDPALDDLNDLLDYACMSGNSKVVEYLISLGANPNRTRAEWQSPLQWAIWSLYSKVGLRDRNQFDYRSEGQLDIVKALARHGAKLPLDKDTLQQFRRVLLSMNWYGAFELVKELKGASFAEDEVWRSVLEHPKIREHFRLRREALRRLFPRLVLPPSL